MQTAEYRNKHFERCLDWLKEIIVDKRSVKKKNFWKEIFHFIAFVAECIARETSCDRQSVSAWDEFLVRFRAVAGNAFIGKARSYRVMVVRIIAHMISIWNKERKRIVELDELCREIAGDRIARAVLAYLHETRDPVTTQFLITTIESRGHAVNDVVRTLDHLEKKQFIKRIRSHTYTLDLRGRQLARQMEEEKQTTAA